MHLAHSSRKNLYRFRPRHALSLLAACLVMAASAQQPAPEKNAAPAEQKTTTPQADKPAVAKAALTEPQQKLADDAARLLELATELKAEVDKTSKDTLSLKVVRQAESIEKLAKGVKQELKQAGGAS